MYWPQFYILKYKDEETYININHISTIFKDSSGIISIIGTDFRHSFDLNKESEEDIKKFLDYIKKEWVINTL